ncbi:MAG: hypothetical protein ACYC9S_03350 [Leptospirales bacterium]
MISVDTTTMERLINNCFDLSMDGRLSDELQDQFLTEGKRLRESLVNLISARFNDGTQAVMAANQQLQEVNNQTAQFANDQKNSSNVLSQITALVNVLDGLLKLASSFV